MDSSVPSFADRSKFTETKQDRFNELYQKALWTREKIKQDREVYIKNEATFQPEIFTRKKHAKSKSHFNGSNVQQNMMGSSIHNSKQFKVQSGFSRFRQSSGNDGSGRDAGVEMDYNGPQSLVLNAEIQGLSLKSSTIRDDVNVWQRMQ